MIDIMVEDAIKDHSTTSTSAFLIYETLKNSDHPLLEEFNISFPSEGCLVEESNVIIVAEANEEWDKETSHSSHYKALTEIYIKTKKADYEEVSKLLRSARKAIRNVLKSNKELRRRYMIFRNSSAKYGSKFALKAANMLVQTNEIDFYNDNEDYSEFDVFFKDVKIE